MVETTAVKLRDGRLLDVLALGPEVERAVLFHHGTPADAGLWGAGRRRSPVAGCG